MAKPHLDVAAAKEALHSTKDRRTSAFKEVANALEEPPPKVDIVWDITCPEQVTQLANDKPEHFWDWLVMIAKERDTFRKHTQAFDTAYGVSEEKVEDLEAQLEDCQKSLSGAEEKASKWRIKADDLQKQLKELDSLALASNYQVSSSAKAKKSSRHPDPPIFTDGKDPSWDDWSSQIREKLRINADHYPADEGKVIYVLSRLGGEAVKHTHHRRQPNAIDPYVAHEEVLEQLAEIYEDVDRVENARRSLARLQMNGDNFRQFGAEFTRLGQEARLGEDHQMQLFRERLPKRLLKPMLAQNALVPFPTLKSMKDYLTKLDNAHSHDLSHKPKAPRTTTRSTREFIGKTPPVVASSHKTTVARVPVCYRCGEIGHLKSEKSKCKEEHQTPKGKAAQEAAIREIQIAEGMIDVDDSSASGPESSSDSGNE